ncbi:MAG: hypothetical protein DRJ31_08505 [Candidatus Methanomethylicota archaeon]|uniref:ABC transporter domain-containing protein n=1 Tax=Thermoproteota archaeon TaxID=2056631 RepID=A0A497EM42_9CREN|nr:MAG: hypothetical protein DRJ31_08505 [Candidatus Verstraetearchaeota archaeon]
MLLRLEKLLEAKLEVKGEELLLEVCSGEVIGLYGPLGSGKSSILRCLAGLASYKGSISLLGKELRSYRRVELVKLVGFISESPSTQFVANRVGDEVAFTLENLGLRPDEIRLKVSEALKIVGLEGFERRKIDELSWGQRHRVALASIFVAKPKVLLVDDFFVYLDPPTRRVFSEVLRKYADEGAGVIVASGRREFLKFVDRVVELKPMKHEFVAKAKVLSSITPCELKASSLCFGYEKDQLVLKDVSLSLSPGEILAVMGKNGSGKTTLGKLLTKVLKPRAGFVRLSEAKAKLAYISQNPDSQFIGKTPIEDVKASLRRGFEERLALDILSSLGIGDFAHEKVYGLDIGVKKLSLIASILALSPSIAVIDEPTSGLDDFYVDRLSSVIKELSKSGMALAILTHDLYFAKIANRAIVLRDGVVSFEGSPYEVEERLF